MPIDRRIRCERDVLVVTHARHAYGWYTRRREDNDFRPKSAQLYGQMAAEWLTWESERSGRAIRHQINRREKRIGKLLVDGWCCETNTVHPSRVQRRQRETHGSTARRDPKEHRLPTSLCQGRRAVGMRVERDEKRSGRVDVTHDGR